MNDMPKPVTLILATLLFFLAACAPQEDTAQAPLLPKPPEQRQTIAFPGTAYGPLRHDLNLMQGFLTLPFAQGTTSRVFAYKDLDERKGMIRDWKAEMETYEGHSGTEADPFPHLHFDFQVKRYLGGYELVDPYRDSKNPASLSLWTVDNSPQYP